VTNVRKYTQTAREVEFPDPDYRVTRADLEGDDYIVTYFLIRKEGEHVGAIQMKLFNESAYILGSTMKERYRRRGLARKLYVAAINDQIGEGLTVYSDDALSAGGLGIWNSLQRSNPDSVEKKDVGPVESGEVRYRFQVKAWVERRPVHVHGHRRRA